MLLFLEAGEEAHLSTWCIEDKNCRSVASRRICTARSTSTRRTLWTCRTLWPRRSYWSTFTDRSLQTYWPLFSLIPLVAFRPSRTCRSWRTWWTYVNRYRRSRLILRCGTERPPCGSTSCQSQCAANRD